jgi:transposase
MPRCGLCRSDLKGALGIAAMAASRSKDTYLSARYRRILSRRGPLKAVVAIERTMLTTIWHMAKTGALYDDPGGDFYTRLGPTEPSSAPSNS